MTLVGIGYDSPPPRRRAARSMLGGVEIPHERGLEGHSDADVLAHAVIDALLGRPGWATSASTSPTPTSAGADADSIELLRAVVAAAWPTAGWRS